MNNNNNNNNNTEKKITKFKAIRKKKRKSCSNTITKYVILIHEREKEKTKQTYLRDYYVIIHFVLENLYSCSSMYCVKKKKPKHLNN